MSQISVASRARTSAWSDGAAIVAMLALVAASFALHALRMPPNHDNEWYLIAAERLLAGGRYTLDFLDPNPPLILWLQLPAIGLARALGCDIYTAYSFYVCALILLSAWLARPMLMWLTGDQRALGNLLSLVYVVVLVLDPGYDFGQREHLFVILAGPGLLWYAAREGGREAPVAWASVGLAAVAVLIKPYFVLVPAGLLAATMLRRRSWHAVLDPAVAVFAVVGVLYLAVVLLAYPDFLPGAQLQQQVYFAWSRAWITVVRESRDAAVLLCLAIVLAELVPLAAQRRWFLRALCIAAGACLIAGLLQKKGWTYHMLPTRELAWYVVVGAALLLARAAAAERSRLPAAAVLGSIALLGVFLGVRPLNEMLYSTRAAMLGEPLIAELRQLARGKSVLMLTGGFTPGVPGMVEARLAGRAPGQLLLPGVVRLAAGDAAQRALADRLRPVVIGQLVQDLERFRPAVVAVDLRSEKQALPPDFDMLAFYRDDPAFQRSWAAYRPARSIAGWAFYQRVGAD